MRDVGFFPWEPGPEPGTWRLAVVLVAYFLRPAARVSGPERLVTSGEGAATSDLVEACDA